MNILKWRRKNDAHGLECYSYLSIGDRDIRIKFDTIRIEPNKHMYWLCGSIVNWDDDEEHCSVSYEVELTAMQQIEEKIDELQLIGDILREGKRGLMGLLQELAEL